MIIFILGSAFSGKSTFLKNNFADETNYRNFKDITKLCEFPNKNTVMLGYYKPKQSMIGIDTIRLGEERKDIALQVFKIVGKYDKIVVEGNKVCSECFLSCFLLYKRLIKVYFLVCSWEKAKERMKKTKRYSLYQLRQTFIHSRNALVFCKKNGFDVEIIYT